VKLHRARREQPTDLGFTDGLHVRILGIPETEVVPENDPAWAQDAEDLRRDGLLHRLVEHGAEQASLEYDVECIGGRAELGGIATFNRDLGGAKPAGTSGRGFQKLHAVEVGGIRTARDQVAQPSPGATTHLQDFLAGEGQQLLIGEQCPQGTLTLGQLEVGCSRPHVNRTIGVGNVGSPHPLRGVTG
jgi:hypothetical protein